MNDPVVNRICRIEEKLHYSDMTRAQAEAEVDAELAQEEAIAVGYLNLIKAIRRTAQEA